MEWGKLFALLGGVLLVWWMIYTIRNHPEIFSKGNLSQSFSTMGFLGLILIAFVALCVLLLRA